MSEVLEQIEAEPTISAEPVRVWREINATRINEILNDPSVRPWVAPEDEGELDMKAAVANPSNYMIMGEHGGVMFFRMMPGLYEAHTQVLAAGRGKWTLEMTRAAVHWLYTHTDAYEIMTRIPRGHIGARAAALATGLRYDFTRPDACKFLGKVRDVHVHSQRMQEWIREAPGLVERGEWFHRRMAEEADRLGIADPMHDDDENHNRHAGAAIEMAMNEQPMKAVAVYNRWALAARHKPVELIGIDPVVVKFDIGLLFIGPHDIEVVATQ